MHVPSGMSAIIGRISAIQSRIEQIVGGDSTPPAPVNPDDTPNGFGAALDNAKADQAAAAGGAGAYGAPGAPGSLLPLSPDGQQIRPLQTSARDFDPIIKASATKYGISPDLVRAVITAESDGNPKAVSRAGALGLMQLMPENVSEYGVNDPFDPIQNIDGGTHQLSTLLEQYGGNIDLALAAYNAGPGAVKRYGGVPPYTETQDYIRKIHGLMDSK